MLIPSECLASPFGLRSDSLRSNTATSSARFGAAGPGAAGALLCRRDVSCLASPFGLRSDSLRSNNAASARARPALRAWCGGSVWRRGAGRCWRPALPARRFLSRLALRAALGLAPLEQCHEFMGPARTAGLVRLARLGAVGPGAAGALLCRRDVSC